MAGINMPRGRRVLAVLAVVLVAAGAWVWARSAASVPLAPAAVLRVDTSRPGNEFAPGAVGLSTEALELSSGRLSASHSSLVRLMRLLGPSTLRVGGNSVDFSWWTSSGEPPPRWATNTVTPADLVVLHGLLSATGWRVLLGVDLGHFEPARAANEARYAKEILGTSLIGVEIGNEPNDFHDQQVNLRSSTYGVTEYLPEAEAYRQALEAESPNVAVYGPALTESSWLTQIGPAARMFTGITQHYYPSNGCLSLVPSTGVPQPTVPELLSPTARLREDEALKALLHAGAVAGRPTWIAETGDGACLGKSTAATAFGSALWALDWALRASSSGVVGLSFHGRFGVCHPYNQSPICAPNAGAARAGEVTPQPEYYGLLAASRLEGGRFVPTNIAAPDALPNLTTWATVAPDGTVRIAIDNLTISGPSQPVSIPATDYVASKETLIGPSSYARSQIVLGGVSVPSEGQWRPRLVPISRIHRSFRVIVRPASAAIITLLPKH